MNSSSQKVLNNQTLDARDLDLVELVKFAWGVRKGAWVGSLLGLMTGILLVFAKGAPFEPKLFLKPTKEILYPQDVRRINETFNQESNLARLSDSARAKIKHTQLRQIPNSLQYVLILDSESSIDNEGKLAVLAKLNESIILLNDELITINKNLPSSSSPSSNETNLSGGLDLFEIASEEAEAIVEFGELLSRISEIAEKNRIHDPKIYSADAKINFANEGTRALLLVANLKQRGVLPKKESDALIKEIVSFQIRLTKPSIQKLNEELSRRKIDSLAATYDFDSKGNSINNRALIPEFEISRLAPTNGILSSFAIDIGTIIFILASSTIVGLISGCALLIVSRFFKQNWARISEV